MIEYYVDRHYKSVYHDPVFDGYLNDVNLSADQASQYQVMEFQNCQINGTGMTFGSSPFTQSSNLRITTASGNPAAGSTISKPLIYGDFPVTLLKQIATADAGVAKSHVLFAIPMPSVRNTDIIYMVGYLYDVTWSGGNNAVYFYFKVSFIKNSYNPDTASGADKLYTSTWDQRSCGVVFSSSKVLFVVSAMSVKNDSGQFVPSSIIPEGVSPDLHILSFAIPNVDNFNSSEGLPGVGDEYKYQIASSNRAIQSVAPQPGVTNQSNSGLMFVAPAYVQIEYSTGISYEALLKSDEVGEVSEPGGFQDGTFEYEHDQINISNPPGIGMSTSGMYHVYQIYQDQLAGIGHQILDAPDPYEPPTPPADLDIAEAIIDTGANFIDAMKGLYESINNTLSTGDLVPYVIDLHMIPVQPLKSSSTVPIEVGWKTLTARGYPVTSDYVDVSCGSVQTKEFFGAFPDYISRIQLFLPFVGFVPVQAEWFQNATIGVSYRFNVIDGSFMCFVTGYGRHINKGLDYGYRSGLLAQYSGNACLHMPITGENYAAMLAGQIGAAGGVLANAAYGNIAGAAGSAINMIMMKPNIAQSNAYSASAAVLSHRKPFFMISRPTSHYSELYQHEQGLPANITSRLGDLTGFVQMKDVHLDGIPCTDRERAIIRSKLAKGVIV